MFSGAQKSSTEYIHVTLIVGVRLIVTSSNSPANPRLNKGMGDSYKRMNLITPRHLDFVAFVLPLYPMISLMFQVLGCHIL